MAEELSTMQQIATWPVSVKNYVEELQLEMKRVTWPPWKQVRSTTAVVLAAIFAFAGYFFVVDFVVNRMISKLFETLAK